MEDFTDELEGFAQEVAAALGNEWTAAAPGWVDEGERPWSMHLTHASGVRLLLSQAGGMYSRSGKVEVSTSDVYPDGFKFHSTVYVGSDDPQSADIRVSYSRGAGAVAGEITRRLWDKAQARHAFVQEAVDRHLSYRSRIDAAADAFEQAMPEGWRRHTGQHADPERPEFYGPHHMKATARSDGMRLNLDLVEVSPQLAVKIAALIAADRSGA